MRTTGALTTRLCACALLLAGLLASPVLAQSDAEAPSFKTLPPASLNFYGSPGLMDMPSSEMLPDGQFTAGISWFGGQGRTTLTFQALPWVSASFRYNSIRDWNLGGFDTYYDRGFDLRFRLFKETRRRPEITLGFQDFIGTGIYAAEYIVATKTFNTPGWGAAQLPGRLKLTAGLGWGRLGSSGSIGSPFGKNRPSFDPSGTGGELAFDQWFRGPMAPFGGIEYLPNDRWGFKAEYSSDAYVTETQTTNVFEIKSQFNFGVEYQATPGTRLGVYYMYGSEIGVTVQFQANPYVPPIPLRVPAPEPIAPRPDRATNPEAWDQSWAASAAAAPTMRDVLEALLEPEGLTLESLTLTATRAELRFRNRRYQSVPNAIGRAARTLAQVMPASVETFVLVPVSQGIGLSATEIRRSDLEALEFDGQSTEALLAVTGFGDAGPPAPTALEAVELYPSVGWAVGPYFSPAYFDPDRPFRFDVGVELSGNYQPAPGWLVSGAIWYRLAGNVADSRRTSNSQLPPVRTNQVLYAQEDITLNNLYVSKQWQPGQDLYARITVGYLEEMFGGISTELLWKPVSSPLGFGIEANYVRQRDFDQRFGFQDYTILTGHASAYLEFGEGLLGQIDVGRYLAGDYGATFGLDRVFDNGWMVGGFFTLTNVSAEEFGEGSFDKGIRFRIPISWFLGLPTRQGVGTTIRPIQRDGGQRVNVPNRLYGQVREAHRKALVAQWARVWE